MKKITLLFILHFSFLTFHSFAQSCLEEGITFTTQEQIDNFQTNYPGCFEIEGNVIINGEESITNLSGLNVLTSIGGNLDIYDNDILMSLQGLESLNSIHGDLIIGHPGYWNANDSLTSLSGLDNLDYLGGDLSIACNLSLINIAALGNINYVGGSIYIGYPNAWGTMGGNSSLTNLTGLENITVVEGDLHIHSNPVLTTLEGLNNIISIGGNLHVSANESLTNFSGLDNLTTIGGGFNLFANWALTSLSGLDSLDVIGGDLDIVGNSVLSVCEIPGLCNYLSNPNGSVNIYYNAPGCDIPPEIANACGITLPCLLYGNYYLFSQTQIDSFQVNYPGCTNLEGNVKIRSYSNDITNLNGLNVVTSIGGDLCVNCNYLTSLSGLDNLTTIGGSLSFGELDYHGGPYGNARLTSLAALSNLDSIGANLEVYGNDSLVSLSGLDNLEDIAGDLNINYNPFLSVCEAEGICAYLANPNGGISIYYNASGCNSQEEVEEACGIVGTSKLLVASSRLQVYPNPSVGVSYIKYNLTANYRLSTVDLRVYDMTGKQVKTLVNQKQLAGEYTVQFDASELTSGLYLIRLQAGNELKTMKIIITN